MAIFCLCFRTSDVSHSVSIIKKPPWPTADNGTRKGRSDPYVREQGLEKFRSVSAYAYVLFVPGMNVPSPDSGLIWDLVWVAAVRGLEECCPWRYIAAEDRPRLQ